MYIDFQIPFGSNVPESLINLSCKGEEGVTHIIYSCTFVEKPKPTGIIPKNHCQSTMLSAWRSRPFLCCCGAAVSPAANGPETGFLVVKVGA